MPPEAQQLAPATSIADYFKPFSGDFEIHASFHTLHIRKDFGQILLEVKKRLLGTLFFHHLTFEGTEGHLPEMWDSTPKAAGLHFALAANSRDILLVEAQERLGAVDFAAPMYDTITGGMMRGYLQVFKPLVNETAEDGSVLLDLSAWLLSFGSYQPNGLLLGPTDSERETMLVGIKAFPKNFMLRLTSQPKGGLPLKAVNDSRRTQFWTAGFCMLPELPMVPRPFDRRVGFFTTPILVGGATRATLREHVISRWDLKRRGGKLLYCIDPAVPSAYHSTLKKGVEAWNVAFSSAGFEASVLQCVAKGDVGWPDDYSRGDARFIAIHMTEPQVPVLGYGPSVVDFRSGEILAASIVLGFRPFLEQVSQYSLEALDNLREKLGCGSRMPLVDADHPDVLRTLLKTVTHEVGHTLGLRHNFVAAEDGNSSVMEYVDPLDTTDPSSPRYGGHFLKGIGNYDVYAIRYGYTSLSDERGVRHSSLVLLANGQGAEEVLDAAPHNPLFATDENVGGVDPRVFRFGSSARRFGRDKLEFTAQRRKELLDRVECGAIYPETYTNRLSELMYMSFQHVANAVSFIGGAEVDVRRVLVEPCSAADARGVLCSVVDFVVGPTLRLSPAETRHFLSRTHTDSVYSLEPSQPLRIHSRYCSALLAKLLHPDRVERLEAQRVQMQAPMQTDDQPIDTYDLLIELAFGEGHSSPALMHPFTRDGACSSQHLSEAGRDPLRAEVRLLLAEHVASLQRKGQHAAVRAAAAAFAGLVCHAIKVALAGQERNVAAPWLLFAREISSKRRILEEDVGEELHEINSDNALANVQCRCCIRCRL